MVLQVIISWGPRNICLFYDLLFCSVNVSCAWLSITCRSGLPQIHLLYWHSLSSILSIFINVPHLYSHIWGGPLYIFKTVCPGNFKKKFANYWSKSFPESIGDYTVTLFFLAEDLFAFLCVCTHASFWNVLLFCQWVLSMYINNEEGINLRNYEKWFL